MDMTLWGWCQISWHRKGTGWVPAPLILLTNSLHLYKQEPKQARALVNIWKPQAATANHLIFKMSMRGCLSVHDLEKGRVKLYLPKTILFALFSCNHEPFSGSQFGFNLVGFISANDCTSFKEMTPDISSILSKIYVFVPARDRRKGLHLHRLYFKTPQILTNSDLTHLNKSFFYF